MNTAKKAALILVTAGMAVAAASGSAVADAGVEGAPLKSPGVASGDVIQVPVNVPVNVRNAVDVVGLLNPAYGNTCADQ